MIRSTPTAVPKRLPALSAKAIVLTVVTAVTAAVAIALSVAVALPTLHAHDVAIDLGDSETQRILLGGALCLVAIVPSCAFVRLSAGALATVLGLILLSRTCPGDPRVVPPEPQPVPAVYGRPPDHDHPGDDRPAPCDLDRYRPGPVAGLRCHDLVGRHPAGRGRRAPASQGRLRVDAPDAGDDAEESDRTHRPASLIGVTLPARVPWL